MAGQHLGEGVIEAGDHGFNEFATVSTAAIRLRGNNDTFDRFVIQADGTTLIGAGAAAPTPAGNNPSITGSAALVESIQRSSVEANTIVGATTGVMDVTLIWLPSGLKITSLGFLSGTTALATPTHGFVALYTQAGAFLAQSTDNITFAVAASTVVTTALSTPFTTTFSGLYYVASGLTATTMPTYSGSDSTLAAMTIAPIAHGTAGTAVGATAPATLGTVTPTAGFVYWFVS